MVRSLFYVLILLLLYFIIQFIFFPNPPKLLAKIPPSNPIHTHYPPSKILSSCKMLQIVVYIGVS